MTTLTRAVMIESLIKNQNFRNTDAKQFVETFFNVASETLATGQSVKLTRFGNFNLRDKNERPGRDPMTGKDYLISARRVVTFIPSELLRQRVNNKNIHQQATEKQPSEMSDKL